MERLNALVTGAGRGIGRAVALALAGEGARVVVSYLQDEASARQTAAEVEERGGEAILAQGDVRNERHLETLAGTLDPLHLLVHNAAMGSLRPMETLRASHWDLTLETSLRPFFLLTRRCLDRMPPGASVIGISSLGSRRHIPGYAAMGAAKAGVEALTRQLAVELGPRGIRVNTVCAGITDTRSLEHLPHGRRMLEAARAHTPLGRAGRPEDVAGAVMLLASQQASFITGQVLVVDGGLSLLSTT